VSILYILSVLTIFAALVLAQEAIKVNDQKALKKVFKDRANVLVLYNRNAPAKAVSDFGALAKGARGRGTLAIVDCKENKNTKKMCDEAAFTEPFVIKFYREGEFVKDYIRPLKAKTLDAFLADPNSDPAWEEEESAKDVVHLNDDLLLKTIALKKPTLVMFYAPWCGHCKKMKPDFAKAATALKGKAIIAGLDANAASGKKSAAMFNVTGFPTIKYFDEGKYLFDFGGSRDLEGLLAFMKNPAPPPPPPAPEVPWSEVESDVAHLGDNFDEFISAHNSTLVMFYAPWCGHCKAAKPEYTEAAKILKEENVSGKLAAVDATVHPELGSRFDVKGYPTIIYFKDGKQEFQYSLGRKKDDFLGFMRNPSAPPPPPPPEPQWSDTPSKVTHLTSDTFDKTIKRRTHTLVMFYAPWCGHCKAFKPAYTEAAEELAKNTKVRVAAIDCTSNQDTCSQYGVEGYPTIKYFFAGKELENYQGGRTKDAVIDFLSAKAGLKTEL